MLRLLLWVWMWLGWYPGLATICGWVLVTQARPTGLVLIGMLA